MNSDQVQSLIRNILIGFGSSGAVFGVQVGAATWEVIVSGAAAVAGVLWGLWFHSGATKAQLGG